MMKKQTDSLEEVKTNEETGMDQFPFPPIEFPVRDEVTQKIADKLNELARVDFQYLMLTYTNMLQVSHASMRAHLDHINGRFQTIRMKLMADFRVIPPNDEWILSTEQTFIKASSDGVNLLLDSYLDCVKGLVSYPVSKTTYIIIADTTRQFLTDYSKELFKAVIEVIDTSERK